MNDKCSGCIRINPEMKLTIKMCPKCNEETYRCYLDGRTYVMECTNCGHKCISVSHYGNCESQRDVCEYILDFSNVNKEGLIEFGKRYNVEVVAVLQAIRMKKVVRLRCELSEVLEEEDFLKSINLEYIMEPPMKYSNFYTCKEALRTKWLNSIVEVVIEE